MKKLIGVITENSLLFNKIRLLLRDIAEAELVIGECDPDRYDLIFADTDTVGRPELDCVTLGKGGDISLPFYHEDIINAVVGTDKGSKSALTLSSDGKHAYLFGEAIKLTEVEYKLLEALILADGFISREEILGTVWGEGFDQGVVNVYVCYLRRKLEKSGSKVIISSRNEGYKIDDKYRRKG